jgi:RimJ/RimL family protein N-acetyltransferase
VTIRLEPLGETHLDALRAVVEDPDVQRFTRVPVPPPPDFPRRWLGRYEEGRLDGSREAFAIVDADGAFLGLALAPRIEREAREVKLGYLVAPWARGRGVAVAGLRLLTDWAFEEIGALRSELLIDVDNEPSKRVAERSGYVREGVLRSTYLKQDLRSDTEIWSRLPTDPPPP